MWPVIQVTRNTHNKDFSQTLGVWGAGGPGAYVILPILGPRTVRDIVVLAGDYYTDTIAYVEGLGVRNAFYFYIIRAVNSRSEMLNIKSVLDEVALDECLYVRDAYLQRRLDLVYDGNQLEEDFDVYSA